MLFTSIDYFIFLFIALIIYYITGKKWRWIVALVASYAFFGLYRAPQTFVALILVTADSYCFGIKLGKTKEGRPRTAMFWSGTGICIFLLVIVKYIPSFIPSLTVDSPYSFFLNTIGVSYFTFQAISYLADVYLGTSTPEYNLGLFALSLAFFPKVAQGPIERTHNLLPQIKIPKQLTSESTRSALLLIAFGLAKKVIIADRLALYVNSVYGDIKAYTGLPILLATYAYAFQIYFDFSGYTDIARGSARLFGIELTKNFNAPYMATSVAEFWRRWHISFSTWILDYIFRPLQMLWRDLGKFGTAFALIITFLVSGIWHGAKWGFIIWGALHGLYMAISVFYVPIRKKLLTKLGLPTGKKYMAWKRFITFNLVCFAWIFFRANNISDAVYAFSHIIDVGGSLAVFKHLQLKQFVRTDIFLGQSPLWLFIVVMAMITCAVIQNRDESDFWRLPGWLRWCLGYALLFGIFFLSAPGNQFIYSRF